MLAVLELITEMESAGEIRTVCEAIVSGSLNI